MGTTNAPGLEPILEEYKGASRDALIPILQRVQDAEGFLSKDALAKIGRRLNLPTSKIYGVATFYNQFRFQPKGKYHVMLCRGTACHVKGSKKLLEAAVKILKLQPGQTSKDRMFSLEVVACMGACGLSPVINVNGEFYAKVSPMKLSKIVEECRIKEAAYVQA